MRFGIVTLVSDNYGNKYQNIAVEQLLSEYGEVETFGLEGLYSMPASVRTPIFQKLSPGYIREVLISRPMYQYDINRVDRGVIYNLIYTRLKRKELLRLKAERNERFIAFSQKYLHISDRKLNHENTDKAWSGQYDYFICGSDQIWNPSYSTTSGLAFCSFAPEKTICLSPSFGVSEIPEYRKKEYAGWLQNIYALSVREDAGQKIIKELTGRDAEVLLDPTMLIPIEKWNKLCKKPQVGLPDKYIVCYFLGRITRDYRRRIQEFARTKGLPVVMLFDITAPQYYTMDPAEVLYTIKHSEYVLTDSFHGSVFSVLFHKNFEVFARNEGGASMNSRIETLMKRFGLDDGIMINSTEAVKVDIWANADSALEYERRKAQDYLSQIITEKIFYEV